MLLKRYWYKSQYVNTCDNNTRVHWDSATIEGSVPQKPDNWYTV